MRRRSRKPLALLGWMALGCSAWGCTLLVGFDEVADGGPTVVDDEDSGRPLPVRDAGTDARTGTDAAVIVLAEPPCDGAFPLAQVGGCASFQDNGRICARNERFTYPAGRDKAKDLVTCKRTGAAGNASCVRHCAGTGGCASLPEGFPDQCDTCEGRPNGTYCGNTMGFATTASARLLVTCAANRMSTVVACDAGCAARTDTTAGCK